MKKISFKELKRIIRESLDDIIFENEYFALVRKSGVGMNNTPWKGLDVISKGIADENVVYISLNPLNNPDYNGEPIVFKYKDCRVNHGMISTVDTLEETEEYIVALQEAVKFARRVNDYLDTINNKDSEEEIEELD